MKDLINQVVGYLAGFSVEQWIWLAVAGIILAYLHYLLYLLYNQLQKYQKTFVMFFL